jgi:hypothetical protein
MAPIGDIRLNLNKSALDTQLKSPAGNLWRWMENRGNRAVSGAKRQVGVDTGKLRQSIHKRHNIETYGQSLWIGSNTVSYAYMHHQGTKPHLIAPKSGTILRMGSSRIVHGPVMHPGTRSNPFLSSQTHHFRY